MAIIHSGQIRWPPKFTLGSVWVGCLRAYREHCQDTSSCHLLSEAFLTTVWKIITPPPIFPTHFSASFLSLAFITTQHSLCLTYWFGILAHCPCPMCEGQHMCTHGGPLDGNSVRVSACTSSVQNTVPFILRAPQTCAEWRNEQQHKETRFNMCLRRLEEVGMCLNFPPYYRRS